MESSRQQVLLKRQKPEDTFLIAYKIALEILTALSAQVTRFIFWDLKSYNLLRSSG
jgi:hypothetical protein